VTSSPQQLWRQQLLPLVEDFKPTISKSCIVPHEIHHQRTTFSDHWLPWKTRRKTNNRTKKEHLSVRAARFKKIDNWDVL